MSIVVNSKKIARTVLRATRNSLARKAGLQTPGVKSQATVPQAGPSREELSRLSRERLLHLANQSSNDEFIYRIFDILYRLKNFKSATKVASLLDIGRLNDVHALTIARAMLSSDKGVEGDLLIQARLKAHDLHAMDGRTALAFTDALYSSGLELDQKLDALEKMERGLQEREGVDERARKHAKWTIFRLKASIDNNVDVLKFAELDRLDVNEPSYQLRYLTHLKAHGHDAELADLLGKLGQHFSIFDPVLFSANLKVDPLWLKAQSLGCSDFSPTFLKDLQILQAISDQRKALPLFESLYQRMLSEQTDRYEGVTVFEKSRILKTLLVVGEVDHALGLVNYGIPNTILPATTARGLNYFSNDDYLSAKSCFFEVLEEDPSDGPAAQGGRLTIPRTGGTMRDILDIRARIGYGSDSKGRLGILQGIGSEQTISLLMSGDYVAGLYSKRWASSWQLLKSLYGEKFLNYEQLCLDPGSSRRLFVIGDEGVGDEIRTAQFYAQLAERFGEVTISCDPRLQAMFERAFPQIKFIPVWRFRRGLVERQSRMQGRITGFSERLSNLLTEECRSHLEAADSITFGQNLFFNSFTGAIRRPEPGAYLNTDKTAFSNTSNGRRKLRVGILWRSHFRTAWREFMYLHVEDFAPLTALEDVEFWSIQHSIDPDEKAFCKEHGINLIEGVDLFDDFEGFAPYLKGMDLLIGISSAPIELGAALGTPVWMLGFSPENYFLRTGGGASEDDRLTLNSTVVAPEWIDFSAPRNECVSLVFQEVCRRLRSLSSSFG